MKHIIWQTRSKILFDSIHTKKLSNFANGGNAYDYYAAMALSQVNRVSVDKKAVQREGQGLLSYWFGLRSSELVNGVAVVREPYPIVFGRRNLKCFKVAMIHHLYDKSKPLRLKHQWFFSRLEEKLRKQDLVVTVSKYWKQQLADIGCNNVKIIYNSFNLGDFDFSENEIKTFRNKMKFGKDRPLVYIGNASPQKGVREVYHSLKDKKFNLVMTGVKNQAKDLPVRFFNFSRVDYLKLLSSCDIVITMSSMIEGWNRVAHEAMLSKTPVIGSGTGGMKELLCGGGQLILDNIKELPDVVSEVLENKDRIGQNGFKFVKQFDKNYFSRQWTKLFN